MKSRASQWAIGLISAALGLGGVGLAVSNGLVQAAPPQASAATDMVVLPAGEYTPLLQGNGGQAPVVVEAFALDTYPVTNAQYLAFVRANPRWQRSQISPLFADDGYLRHWHSDVQPADAADEATVMQRPVTYVSWFAARAYCKWQGKRLPSIAEWEYAALASAEAPDGHRDPVYRRRLLEWYAQPSPPLPPPLGSGGKNFWGVYDLHGVIWEWVADFHTALVTGESRGDSDLERSLFCGAGAKGVAEQERVNYPAFMRYALRSSLQGHYTVRHLGFRCAKEIP